MASNEYQIPDLASILQTLSAYAPTPAPSIPNNGASYQEEATQPRDDDEYEPPASFSPQQPPPLANPIPHPPSQETTSYNPTTHYPPKPTTAPQPDPSTITTWPAALQCVMKTVAQNEAHQARIRRLIRTQNDHEKQWWAGREALIEKQKARAEKKKTLDAVLKSVGGNVEDVDVSTPEDDSREVGNYDMKVYKASTEMAKALDSELRHLGTPFFVIRPDLIGSGPSDTDIAGKPAAISREELVKLQKRMIGLLEDLCKE
ncbi:hypothetical protein FQN54_008930 [Arachnomyces sp. PD_36]|nr:hypothetical protein FQN54_008930 [Arachnomyces sp. PD_36]